jgi:hypothetical protein
MAINTIKEEFSFFESLFDTTKTVEVLYMAKIVFDKQNFQWKENLHIFCRDGDPAMLGYTSGFATEVKKEAPYVVFTHCSLHTQEADAHPVTLEEVVSTAIKVINFTRNISLNRLPVC